VQHIEPALTAADHETVAISQLRELSTMTTTAWVMAIVPHGPVQSLGHPSAVH
jgi:hypothetical protein